MSVGNPCKFRAQRGKEREKERRGERRGREVGLGSRGVGRCPLSNVFGTKCPAIFSLR